MSNHQWSNRVFLCKIVSKYQRISLFAIVTIIIASGFLLPDVFATFGSPVAVSSNARVDGGLGKILENNATSGVVATTNGFYMTWTELDITGDDKILFFAKSSDGITVTTPVQVDATTGDVNREIKDVAIFVDGTTVNILYQLETPTGFGIFNSHSDDDGVSFNAPESIQNWGDTPNIAYDADPLTDLIAVFADDPATGDLDMFVSRNNGESFDVNDNCDRNDVFHPTTVDSQHNLAVKVDGTAIYMVYNAEDKVNLDESIFICISTDQGAGSTNPIEISGTGEETGTFETIILVDDFDLTILFSSDNGGTQELSQLRSSNRGGTFSSQETVENATVCDWSNVTGQYASNAGDTIHVMCLGDSNEGTQTAHSHDMGATYTSFTEVNDDPLDITSLPYVVESSGVFVYYTWANQDDVSLSNSNVFAVSQDEGHTFTSQVLNNGTQSTSPDIGVFLGEVFYAEQNSGDDIQFFFEAFNVQPELSLTGSSSITLSVGDTYTEQGATCTDVEDGSITVDIGGDVVDTSTAGIYTVTYDCTDSGGIEADQITRTVRVELIPIVDLFSIDIFCDNEILGFIGLIPFLEICPIQGIPPEVDDISLDKLTSVQAIFNPTKLVDSKITLLKLDITNSFGQTINNVQITLNYDGPTTATTITKVETIDILDGTNSYFLPENDFIFPIGTTFSADATIEPIVDETNPDNNSDGFTIPVQDTRSLNFLYTPVELITDLNPPPSPSDMGTFSDNSREYVTGIYPISEDDYDHAVNIFPLPVIPTTSDLKLNDEGLKGLYTTLQSLKWFGYNKVVGVVRDGWFSDNTVSVEDPNIPNSEGLSLPDVDNNSFFDSVIIEQDNNLGIVTAHEIFHTIVDLRHTPEITADGFWVAKGCEMGFFDRNTDECIEGERAIDFMVDSTDPLRNNGVVDGVIRAWIEKDQFEDLFENLIGSATDPSVIGIKGIIFDNGTVKSSPWYRLESDLDIPLDSAGEFSLLYLDQSNQLIAQTAFNVSRSYSSSGIDTGIGAFAVRVPDVVGTSKIVINSAGQNIFERSVTTNSPSITVQSPNGGELFLHGETINVTWQSSDPDGDEVSHVVLLSEDGGLTFIPLIVDLVDTQFSFDAPSNIQSDTALIKVVASDGLNTNEDVSDSTFSIQEFAGQLDCNTAVPSQDTLWPPNHKMKDITVEGVTKVDGTPVSITITSIFQDEPTDGPGGDKSPDGAGVGTDTSQIRMERLGNGDGRVYHIFFDAIDDTGATCSGEVLVSVPHDQGGGPAIDGGALFDSTA